MEVTEKWMKYCNANGIEREGAATRLGIDIFTYNRIFSGSQPLPPNMQYKMEQIMERRDLINSMILETKLLKEMEEDIKNGLKDKMMFTGTCPTGMGKTTAAKYLASKYECRYYFTLTEMQKEKSAAKRQFVRSLISAFNYAGRNWSNEAFLINKLNSDQRSVLIIDEAQRLITQDWGYFKVLQDIYDNVPSLSILLLGNFKFFETMFTKADRVYNGISDDEQFLRRISHVRRYSRLTTSDVKLWFEYHNMPLKNNSDYKLFADFFKVRAGLDDLEKIRKELIKNLGKGSLKNMKDATFEHYKAIYKMMHTDVKFKDEETGYEERKQAV